MSVDATPTNERLDEPLKIAGAGVVLENRWKLVRNLASGGYGDVWYANEVEDEKPVAIKILRHDAGNNDPGALARLRFEAEILERINHPNIVQVFGFFESPYGYFVAMEYLDGKAIDQILQSHGPIDPIRAIPLIEQVLDALQAAHDQGVLHRDIKPENIMVMPGPPEVAKLLDFGIAKGQESFKQDDSGVTMVQTRAGGFMGTPRYAAPEQAVGDPMGPSSDLFALGLVTSEWLTGVGRLGGNHSEVMQHLLDGSPIRVSDCPVQWQLWLQKVLDKNPQNRFQSAREAKEGLRLVREFETLALDLPPRQIRKTTPPAFGSPQSSPSNQLPPPNMVTKTAPPNTRAPEIKESSWAPTPIDIAIGILLFFLGMTLTTAILLLIA
ncbi:serine/threonine protein kinase [Microvenator marinus]|jgi:serine/threonine-protein kinase|uniref:Serine/threonine protein kinase n=1 Tax=Microvenator marinus TaxID=2600177 RepID=A0A5B8XMY4_9DELT|nr:serine/threonine-protein kinase [Microvenator marinus]QED27202.1 serine/threonine protein kinase [Microvenator marinus]